MSRASVLVISYSPLRRDARVLRQIRLLAGDHDVTTVGYGEAPDDVVEHVRIPDEIVYWHKDHRLLLARAYQRTYDTMPVQRPWSRLVRRASRVIMQDAGRCDQAERNES